MPEFKAGDICIVTGDTARFRHAFKPGTAVRLIEDEEFTQGHGWECRAVDDEKERWDVATVDLESAAPSAQEVEDALESIREVLRRNP